MNYILDFIDELYALVMLLIVVFILSLPIKDTQIIKSHKPALTSSAKVNQVLIAQKPQINEYYVTENFNYLLKHLPERYQKIQLYFDNNEVACNAYADNGFVVMFIPCLKAKHLSSLVYILAHELGHEVLGHAAAGGKYYNSSPYEEQDADGFGLELYESSGYPTKNFISTYKETIISLFGSMDFSDSTHGTFAYRIQRLQDQLNYLRNIKK